jgi:hypothetical protein
MHSSCCFVYDMLLLHALLLNTCINKTTVSFNFSRCTYIRLTSHVRGAQCASGHRDARAAVLPPAVLIQPLAEPHGAPLLRGLRLVRRAARCRSDRRRSAARPARRPRRRRSLRRKRSRARRARRVRQHRPQRRRPRGLLGLQRVLCAGRARVVKPVAARQPHLVLRLLRQRRRATTANKSCRSMWRF